MESVRRKMIRLPKDAYESGCFFVTVCTVDRKQILANIVGADDSVRPCYAAPTVSLTELGQMVSECLLKLNDEENGISVEKFAVMPNHIHAIICIEPASGGQSRPPLQRVMQRFKSITTRRGWAYGHKTIWQRSFYDHVIRNDAEFLRIWQYIDENPARWAEDEYYAE